MPDPSTTPVIPRATYRLQFRKEFGFAQAAALAPYLARLGVSHVYASPWHRQLDRLWSSRCPRVGLGAPTAMP